MAFAEPVVTELTIDARGAEQGQAQYVRAMANAHAAAQRMTEVNGRLWEANNQQVRVTQQVAAANDNLARSYTEVNDNVRGAGETFRSVGAGIAEHAGLLKIAAVAAYTLSPAFRSFANPAIAGAVSATGVALKAMGPAAAEVATSVGARLLPALSLIGKFTPVLIVVAAAFKLLNATWEQGVALLEKYSLAGQRALFDQGGQEAALEKLTRFQNEKISIEQINRATDLSARLDIAKKTISDFFQVQLDLTDPALKLQNAWVVIAEKIAEAVAWANRLPQSSPQGWVQRNLVQGTEAPDWILSPETAPTTPQSAEDAMRRARARLVAGMGGGFWGRFYGVKDDPPKAATSLSSEFDRFEKSLERQAAAMEAESKAVGASVGEHARLRTEMRLQEAALQDIAKNGGAMEDYEERIKKISDRLGEATQKAAELKLNSDIGFERSQIGRDPVEASIAARLRSVYGDGYVNQMNAALAVGLRFNEQMRQAKELTTEFVTGFAGEFRSQLRQGVNAWEAFGNAGLNALTRLSDKLMDMALSNLVAKAFGGSAGGGLMSLFGFGGGVGTAGNSMTGLAGDPTAGGTFLAGAALNGGMIGSGALSSRYVHPAYFDDAPRMARGGMIDWAAGERPIVGHLGERVLNRQQTADYNAGRSGGPSVVNHYTVHAPGASAEAMALAFAEIRKLRSEVPRMAVGAVSSARTMRPGALG